MNLSFKKPGSPQSHIQTLAATETVRREICELLLLGYCQQITLKTKPPFFYADFKEISYINSFSILKCHL